jgi:hypothetical protein
MSTNPWDANFTPAAVDADLVKDVEAAVTAGEQAAGQVVGTVVSGATQAAEGAVSSVLPGVVPPPPPLVVNSSGGTISQPGITNLQQTLEQVIEQAAKGSAKTALSSLAPSIEAELAKEFQATVQNVVGRVTGGTDTVPVPNLDDFVHADARSRAFRSLVIGLFVAVLTGLGTAAASLGGNNLLTHNGQVAAASIALASVATSVVAYITRLFNEPNVTKPLTSQLPQKVS